MSDAAATGATAVSGGRGRAVFKAGGGRTTILSFLFLILLPFFVSLPAMLYMRAVNGLWDDAAGLLVTALAFTVVMTLLFFELMFSLRARVELGDASVKLRLPSGRGPTPMLRYMKADIPYGDIDRIETRREIYGGTLAPVVLKGARIVTRDGATHRLGYVTEADQDAALPFIVIAEDIARRAGCKVIERGNVRRAVHQKFFGIRAVDDPQATVDERTIAAFNARHRQLMRGLVGGLVLLVVTGITIDLLDEKAAWRDLVTTGKPAPHAAAEKPQPDKTPAKPAR